MRGRKKKLHRRCHNCNSVDTPMWRRSKNGEQLCNACGLYFRNHRSNKPIQRMSGAEYIAATALISFWNGKANRKHTACYHHSDDQDCNECLKRAIQNLSLLN